MEVRVMRTRRNAFSPIPGIVFSLAVVFLAGSGAILLFAADSGVPPEQSDINRDGTVDSEDLLTFQREWHQEFPTVGDLVPITAGNYWRYDTVTVSYTSSEPVEVSTPLSVTVITAQSDDFPDSKVAVFKERPTGGPDRFIYIEQGNGTYRLLGEGSIYPGPMLSYDPTELWIEGPAVPGKIWVGSAIKDTQNIPAVATSSYESNTETVETSGGTYTNCTKMVRMEIGNLGGVSYKANEVLWFKPGLGLVQAEYHRSWTSTPTGVTEAVDVTWSLKEYNIQ
jgi:hypothetical protein